MGLPRAAKWLAAAVVAAALLVLAYQRIHRSEYVEPALRPGRVLQNATPQERQLPVVRQEQGVRKMDPVLLRAEPKGR